MALSPGTSAITTYNRPPWGGGHVEMPGVCQPLENTATTIWSPKVPNDFETLLTIKTSDGEHDRFKSGELIDAWAGQYPHLFDADDVRRAKAHAHTGHQFVEWLAAVKVFEEFGYRSLLQRYDSPSHEDKLKILRRLLPDDIREFLLGRRQREDRATLWPDLLVYKPDYSDYFFCEVKGRDALRPEQVDLFLKLSEKTGHPVKMVQVNFF